MRNITMISLGLLLALGTACIEDNPKTVWNLEENNPNQPNQPNQPPIINSDVDLNGVFVSGHLGNYTGCEDEGYTPDSSGARMSSAPEPAEDSSGLWEGDCAEDGCGWSQCEAAQLTIKLDNLGTAAAEGLIITKLALFNSDGVHMADLPLETVMNAETNEAAPEELEASGSVTLRVMFQGPANPYEFFADESGAYRNSGTMQITVESTNHEAVIIKSTVLYTIDNVAT